MSNFTCQQLKDKLEAIKALKAEFSTLLARAETLAEISKLQEIQTKIEKEIEKTPLFNLISKLSQQFHKRLETLEEAKICTKEKPFIVDINEQKHPVPTFKQILAGLTPELIEKLLKFEEPLLLLTPFSIPTHILCKKAEIYLKEKTGKEVHIYSDSEDSDNVHYFPNNLDPTNDQGKIKSEIIQEQGDWLLSIIDIKRIQKKSTFLIKFFNENDKSGFKGMSYEEYLMFTFENLDLLSKIFLLDGIRLRQDKQFTYWGITSEQNKNIEIKMISQIGTPSRNTVKVPSINFGIKTKT